MESKSPPIAISPTTFPRPTTAKAVRTTGDWPAVPPAPAPVKPTAPPPAPEPPLVAKVAAVRAIVTAPPVVDDSPTVSIPPVPALDPAGSPLRLLRSAVRERLSSADELIWQSRFALTSAGVILAALLLVTLPLWTVLYRLSDTAGNGAGVKVSELVALSMVLMGAFLTGAATWMIMMEMRLRVRMADAGPGAPVAPRPAAVSFGQLPAQVAILAVVAILFLGATILSLH